MDTKQNRKHAVHAYLRDVVEFSKKEKYSLTFFKLL